MNITEIFSETCQLTKLSADELRDKKHKHAPARFMFCRRAIDVFGNNVTLKTIGHEVNYTYSSVIRAWRASYEIKEIRNKYAKLWPSNK
jgi:hypothetical protein